MPTLFVRPSNRLLKANHLSDSPPEPYKRSFARRRSSACRVIPCREEGHVVKRYVPQNAGRKGGEDATGNRPWIVRLSDSSSETGQRSSVRHLEGSCTQSKGSTMKTRGRGERGEDPHTWKACSIYETFHLPLATS